MAELIPVLELEPGAFATRSHQAPQVSSAEDPDGWDRYWRESLADAGIRDLSPRSKGSWLVPLQQFTASETLRTVLAHELEGIEEWDPEQISPLAGGYVLAHGGQEILPGCCGDLSNLAEWSDAAAHTDGVWRQVWIGHPWIHVRAEGDELVFSEPSEANEPAADSELVRIRRDALGRALNRAGDELARFASALASAIGEVRPNFPSKEAVRILTEGHP